MAYRERSFFPPLELESMVDKNGVAVVAGLFKSRHKHDTKEFYRHYIPIKVVYEIKTSDRFLPWRRGLGGLMEFGREISEKYDRYSHYFEASAILNYSLSIDH